MKVDTKKIISDTLAIFGKSDAQKKKFAELTSYVSESDYAELHKSFLTPTSIKINCSQFLDEIKNYDNYFEQWGTQHTHLPRYGLALVNQDGVLKQRDPINGSLYEWNMRYPESPIIETDCKVPTEVIRLDSLAPLNIFKGHWCRSNIFKWGPSADFKPHIDTVIPSPWIRLWATTDVNKVDVRFDNGQGELVSVQGLENGRVYIIDTSVVHDAASVDTVYQLFLSVLPSAINILKDVSCPA